jgi:hypothetical protein
MCVPIQCAVILKIIRLDAIMQSIDMLSIFITSGISSKCLCALLFWKVLNWMPLCLLLFFWRWSCWASCAFMPSVVAPFFCYFENLRIFLRKKTQWFVYDWLIAWLEFKVFVAWLRLALQLFLLWKDIFFKKMNLKVENVSTIPNMAIRIIFFDFFYFTLN